MTTPDPDAEKVKLRANIKSMRELTDWVALAEITQHSAKRLKMKYDAALKEGFSEMHAIILCTQDWK